MNKSTNVMNLNGNIKPLNKLSLAILDSGTNNRDSVRRLDNSELFTIVDVISKIDYIIVKLHVDVDKLKDNIQSNPKEKYTSISFFDIFGYGDEYIYIFLMIFKELRRFQIQK